MHSTNYRDTLITIAEDSVAERGLAPPEKAESPSIAWLTWKVILEHPYEYTSDDVIFTVWADRKSIPEGDRPAARDDFFSKGQACLRASDLGKKYGWGTHHDSDGRVALLGVETDAYQQLAERTDLNVVRAMRSSRR